MIGVEDEIRVLAKEYADRLESRMDNREAEMEEDDKSHFLIYRVLGISSKEGHSDRCLSE